MIRRKWISAKPIPRYATGTTKRYNVTNLRKKNTVYYILLSQIAVSLRRCCNADRSVSIRERVLQGERIRSPLDSPVGRIIPECLLSLIVESALGARALYAECLFNNQERPARARCVAVPVCRDRA